MEGKGREGQHLALGAVDGNSGLRVEKHIFSASTGDYYEIADGVPQQD